MDERRLEWCGSSYRDLLEMPASAQRTFGYALGLAQNGMRYDGTKILKGFRPALVEILEDDNGDT
jgi:phage-related protein